MENRKYLSSVILIVFVALAVFSNIAVVNYSSIKSTNKWEPAVTHEVKNDVGEDSITFFKHVTWSNVLPFLTCWFFVAIGASLVSLMKFQNTNLKLSDKGKPVTKYNFRELGLIFSASFVCTLYGYNTLKTAELNYSMIYGSITSGFVWTSVAKEIIARARR